MIKIKNTKEALQKLAEEDLSPDLLKDLLFQTYIFDTQFTGETLNEIVLVNKDETYKMPDLIPEIEEIIGGYKKTLFIICDSGEGLIVYQEIGGNDE